MSHVVSIGKDIRGVDGIIKTGEYECLYEEGEYHYIRYGDYVVGIHGSLLNTSKKDNKVKQDVGGA